MANNKYDYDSKHNHRNIPALSQEANTAKEEFSTYLKTHFIDTTANSMLRRVEEVRIKVQRVKNNIEFHLLNYNHIPH